MTRPAICFTLALLLAFPAHAEDATPVSTGRGALLMGSQILALSAGAAVSVALGSVWIEDDFRNHGRPDPRVIGANVAIALAVNMALTWILLPDFARVTNDAGGLANVDSVRSETWRRTRWLALVTAVFAGVVIAGAVAEKNQFGSGQTAMVVGAAGSALSVLAFDVTALLTVRQATQASRVKP